MIKFYLYRNLSKNLICSNLLYNKLFLTLLFCTFLLSAFGQVKFYAQVNPAIVHTEEVFEVKFILENTNGNNFSQPDFSNFTLMSGPNRMNSMTVINGNMKKSQIISFSLLAKKPGSFTIGQGAINADDQLLTTKPLKIEVLKGITSTDAQATRAQGDYFVRAEVSNTKPFVGEQILLDYKIYSLVNVSDIRQVSEPEYSNLTKIEVKEFPKSEQRVTLNGKTFAVKTLKRIALYPRKSGNITIEPVNFRFDAPQRMHSRSKNNRSTDIEELDPFGLLMPHEPIEMATNVLNIEVQTAQQTIGNNNFMNVDAFEATLLPEKINITDVAALQLKITTHGDASQVFPPDVKLPATLKISEGKLISENTNSESGEIITDKTFEYLISSAAKNNSDTLLPKTVETFKIPLTYFDTKQKKIVRIESLPLTLTIEDNGKTLAQQNITTTTNGYESQNFIDTYWLWFVGGLGGALAGLIFYLRGSQKNKSIKSKIIDSDEENIAKNKLAQKVQEKSSNNISAETIFELKNLLNLRNENPSLYLSQIQKLLTDYLSKKFSTPVQDLSDSDLRKKFSENNYSEEKQNEYFSLKNAIREAQFAGGSVDLKLLNKQAQDFVSPES